MRVLVIGSGLIGRLTAWRLLVAGHAVSILSQDDRLGTDSAGYVAAAMVSPMTEAISAEPMVKTIGLVSRQLWAEWLQALDAPVYYQHHGTLVVAHQGDVAELNRFSHRAKHVLAPEDYVHLDQQALATKEPQLAERFGQAIYFARESCLDNRQLFAVLGDVLSQHCDWQQSGTIETVDESVIALLTKQYFRQRADHFDQVIDCRGNGAKADINTLRSVRGEVMRVSAPEVDFKHCIRLMHPRYPLYLASRPNHEYVLGATVIESDDRSAMTVRSGLELLSAFYSLHQGFAEARILEMAAHCRPVLPNHLPMMKRTRWGYHLNGFYRHGYLFGPAIVDDLIKLMTGNRETIRFGGLYECGLEQHD